jgi:hypothetical protein
MRNITRFLVLVLPLSLLVAIPASGQPRPSRGPGSAGGKLRQKIAKRIQLIRMNAVITAVGLSPGQAPKFFAVVNQFEQRIRKVRLSNQKIMAQLGQMVRSGRYKAPKINQLAARLMKNKVQIKQLELKRLLAVRKTITAQQMAKLLIALPRIEQRIRRLIRRAQHRHGRPGRLVNPW